VKNVLTSEIEPATFRIVEKYLNKMSYLMSPLQEGNQTQKCSDSSSEHPNGHQADAKCRDFLGHPSDFFLKKDYAS
jgi:hypothetical protein